MSGSAGSGKGVFRKNKLVKDLEAVIFEEDEISRRVGVLASQISKDYEGKDLLMIGILRGAAVFLSDLARRVPYSVQMDFMAVSSYGSATKTSGVVRILKDLEEDARGRDVLIVEDIVDTGLTLNYLLRNLRSREPRSLEVCALLEKEGKRRAPLDIKYLGFMVPDRFVVGYGLDWLQKYRNLPYVATLKPGLEDR